MKKTYLAVLSKNGKIVGSCIAFLWVWQSPRVAFNRVLRELERDPDLIISDFKRVY